MWRNIWLVLIRNRECQRCHHSLESWDRERLSEWWENCWEGGVKRDPLSISD